MAASMAGAVTDTQTFNFSSAFPQFAFTVDDTQIIGDHDNNPATPPQVIKDLGNSNGVLDVPDLGSQVMRIFYQDQITDITQAGSAYRSLLAGQPGWPVLIVYRPPEARTAPEVVSGTAA